MVVCPACGAPPETRLEDAPPNPMAYNFRKRVATAAKPRARKPRPPKPRPQVPSPYPRCRCGLFEVRLEDTGWLWSFGAGLPVRVHLRTGRSVRTHRPVVMSGNTPFGSQEARGPEEVREAMDRVVCASVMSS